MAVKTAALFSPGATQNIFIEFLALKGRKTLKITVSIFSFYIIVVKNKAFLPLWYLDVNCLPKMLRATSGHQHIETIISSIPSM